MRTLLFLLFLPICAGCAELSTTRDGVSEVIDTSAQALGDDRFAVSITTLNMDGYAVARCVAAKYTSGLRDSDDKLLFPVYQRDGGKLTDEFRRKDGIRNQTTTGIQTYQLLSEGEHDGRDTISVDLQLAECEAAGLLAGLE